MTSQISGGYPPPGLRVPEADHGVFFTRWRRGSGPEIKKESLKNVLLQGYFKGGRFGLGDCFVGQGACREFPNRCGANFDRAPHRARNFS